MKLDNHDIKILNELTTDAKTPLRKMATKLGISFVTVMNRIKKMEQNEIIEGYTTKINYEKIGFQIHTIIDVRIAKGKLLALEKKIANSPNVYGVYDCTGKFDATIIAKFKTTRTMDAFIKKIQTYDFVERTETKLVLNTIKESCVKL